MKICHTHAMKMIKELEEQKRLLIEKEDENCIVSYKVGRSACPPDTITIKCAKKSAL